MRASHRLAVKPTRRENALVIIGLTLVLVAVSTALFLTDLGSSAKPDHAGKPGGRDHPCKSHVCDTAQPTVAVTTPSAGATVELPVHVAGTAADDDRVVEVTITFDGGSPLPADGPPSAWAIVLDDLDPGPHTILVRARDRAGNVGVVTHAFEVAASDPQDDPTQEPEPDPAPDGDGNDRSQPEPTGEPTPVDDPDPAPEPDPSCEGVIVKPGTDLRQLAGDSAPGTTFCLAAGVHRFMDAVRPRDGQSFIGTAGTVVSGSKVLSEFRKEGAWWVADGQTQRLKDHGVCEGQYQSNSGTYDSCSRGEDVFFDDVSLWQVDTLAELSSGEFWFDYANSRIYLADDPSGHLVETTVAKRAFGSYSHDADNVTVRGLVVEKFGNQAQFGAIDSFFGSGWVIEDNEVRLNHGAGIRGNAGSVVRNNHVHHNGQLGLAGFGKNLLVEGNLVEHNHTLGFDTSWEAGGSKWQRTDGLVLRDNVFRNNRGHGIWIDIDNINALIEGNRSDGNDKAGIFYEISYDGVIRNNTVSGNGFVRNSSWGRSSGIMIANSQNVEVYGNTVDRNRHGITLFHQDRGSGEHGPYDLRNVNVHDNLIIMETGHTGLMEDVGSQAVFESWNNRFHHNTYKVAGTDRWHWDGRLRSFSEWQALGQGNGSTVSTL